MAVSRLKYPTFYVMTANKNGGPISGPQEAPGWARFSVAGFSPNEYTSDGTDGIEGAVYQLWTITSSTTVTCTQNGIAELFICAAGGGGGVSGQYAGGGGGAGGWYFNAGEFFSTDNANGEYVVTIGNGVGGGTGGDSRIKCGDGVNTVVTMDYLVGGGAHYGGANSNGSIIYMRAGRAGNITNGRGSTSVYTGAANSGRGGAGGRTGMPGPGPTQGESLEKRPFQGGLVKYCLNAGNGNYGSGASLGSNYAAGKNGVCLIRVIKSMPGGV